MSCKLTTVPGVPVRIRLEMLKYSENENSFISDEMTKNGLEIVFSATSRTIGVVTVEAYDLSINNPDSSTRFKIIWGSGVPLT